MVLESLDFRSLILTGSIETFEAGFLLFER